MATASIQDIRRELTAHLRDRLSNEGIKARCRCMPGSSTGIQIFPIAARLEFDESTRAFVRRIAIAHDLTAVRGLPVSEAGQFGFNLYLSEATVKKWISAREYRTPKERQMIEEAHR